MLDPPLESARRRATVTVALVALATGLAAVDFVQQGLRWFQLARLANTCAVSSAVDCRPIDATAAAAAIHRLDVRALTTLIVDAVVLLAAVIAWCVWQHRAQRLAGERLLTPGLKYTPGWAVGWWFVPFANYGMPAATMAELWRASGGDAGSAVDWRSRKLPAYFGWWWGFWVARSLPFFLSGGRIDKGTASVGNILFDAAVLTISALATTVSGVLAILLVRSVQSRLERATPFGFAPRTTQASPLPWAAQPQAPLPWGAEPPTGVAGPAPGTPPVQPEPVAAAAQEPATDGTAEAGGVVFPPPPPGIEFPPPPTSYAPPEPPAWRSPRTFAIAIGVVALAGVAFVLFTSPSMPAAGTAVTNPSASPSVLGSGDRPADWHDHPGDGFTVAAPGDWEEEKTRVGPLSLVDPTGTERMVVTTESIPGDVTLRQYVEQAIAQLKTSDKLKVQRVDVRPVTLPAGPAELATVHASFSGVDETLFQYVLVEPGKAWVLTFAGLADDEPTLGPLADRISGTFEFA